MANVQTCARLIKRCALTNLVAARGKSITVLLSGPHGIGKTSITAEVAKDLCAFYDVIEGSQIGEGVATGLPVATLASDGSTEVTFTKFSTFNKIYRLEKEYYKKATTEGFLNGKLKLNPETGIITYTDSENKKHEYQTRSKLEKIFAGTDNDYKFGEELPVELKLELLKQGEIRLVIILIDELNRAELQTMKELMNILLNRSVNGYDFPWWVSFVAAVNPSSQNSSYATNEMDSAQLDRFLKLKVNANLDNWVDYALERRLNTDLVSALTVSEKCFMVTNDKSLEDQAEMEPSPRSWEIVSYMMDTIDTFNNLKIKDNNGEYKEVFTREEIHEADKDLRSLMIGKVGQTAATTILAAIENKENNIKPSEILTGKATTIDEKIVTKFNKQGKLRQKITSDSVMRYIADHICEYEKKEKSSKAEEKAQYFNFREQIKEFVKMLDSATQIDFAKRIISDNMKASDGSNLFTKIGSCFAKDMLIKIQEFRDSLNDLSK